MNNEKKILKYLYPTKSIREEISTLQIMAVKRNIRYVIIYAISAVFVLIFNIIGEDKIMYIVTNMLSYLLLVIFVLLLYMGNRKIAKLDKKQMEVIINQQISDSLLIVKNRDKFKMKYTVIFLDVIGIPLFFSIYSFIAGFKNQDYNTNPIVIFYLGTTLLAIPIIIFFIIGLKRFRKKQLKLIGKIESKSNDLELFN